MDTHTDSHASIRMLQALRRGVVGAMFALVGSGAALADGLAPGEFEWTPELAPSGPMVIVGEQLPEQRAHVYRNGVQHRPVSTVSSGTRRPRHADRGRSSILQEETHALARTCTTTRRCRSCSG